jgi:two-component system sensor histidine kinase BaeS
MAFQVSHSFKSGFQTYLNQQEEEQVIEFASDIAESYSSERGWQILRERPEIWREIFADPNRPLPPHQRGEMPDEERFAPPYQDRPRPDEEHFLPPRRDGRIPEELTPLNHRIHLEDAQRNWVAGIAPQSQVKATSEWLEVPILVKSQTVGWLVLEQKSLLSGPLVAQFYKQQQSNLFWIIGVAGFTSLVVALFLVRYFLAPLKKLTQGADALSEGRYDFSFEGQSNDEFGELSDRFQFLGNSLKKQKENREQWLVDISHELRTPIAVLRSELEAIQDGIRQPEPQRIDSMHHQVMGLRRLVDDLYLLSKTDSGVYQMDAKTLDVMSLAQNVVSQFESRVAEKGLAIELVQLTSSSFVKGDQKILEQLFVNLLENSLRYTDAPGDILLSILEEGNDLVIRVEDSSPSVSEAHLPNLFKRLYRVDQSRSRQYGGSGLGLSICRNIVIMHGGHISAKASALGGLAIDIRLKRE